MPCPAGLDWLDWDVSMVRCPNIMISQHLFLCRMTLTAEKKVAPHWLTNIFAASTQDSFCEETLLWALHSAPGEQCFEMTELGNALKFIMSGIFVLLWYIGSISTCMLINNHFSHSFDFCSCLFICLSNFQSFNKPELKQNCPKRFYSFVLTGYYHKIIHPVLIKTIIYQEVLHKDHNGNIAPIL